MNKIAKFMKVSRQNFVDAYREDFSGNANEAYDSLPLPRRATSGSAGYDFFTPVDITLAPGESVKIPTAIRAKMEDGWVLCIFPRSGLGFKFRLQLNNTVGIIDADYFGSSNEGHIFIKVTNDSNEGKTLSLKQGDAFAQGIFMPFGITQDDETDAIRDGGFGSTSK